MTRGDRIKTWDNVQLAKWLASVEKEAIIHQHIVGAISEEALAGDWLLFLTKEDNHENNT